jgi:hypothetical protein
MPAAWDGKDLTGSRVRAGVYLVTLRLGSRSTRGRVVMLD